MPEGHDTDDAAPTPDEEQSGAEERRREALGRLARGRLAQESATGGDGVTASPPTSLGRPRPALAGRRARWLGALLVVTLLGAVGGALLQPGLLRSVLPLPGGAATQAPTRPIVPRLDGLSCATDVAWSPRGTRIALLGYSRQCAPLFAFRQKTPGLVNLYDVPGGRLTGQIRPDDAILPHISVPPAAAQSLAQYGATLVPQYSHILWSGDGSRLAILFFVFVPDGTPPIVSGGVPFWHSGAFLYGALLVDDHGSSAQVLLHDRSTDAIEWDLSAGTGTVIPPLPVHPDPGDIGVVATYAPALGYHWAADGTLAPQTPLTSVTAAPPAPALGPVGDPSRDAGFTVWQPGTGELVSISSESGTTLTGIYRWTVETAAWSPDGRYLINSVATAARVQPEDRPQPTPQALAATHLAAVPLLPVRDAGFQAILDRMPTDTYDPFGDAAGVAWRPDGRLVVAQFPTPSPGAANSAPVVYDCQTGRKLAALTPQVAAASAMESQRSFLRWSPDGSRLLLLDARLGTLTIWGPGALPR